LKVLFLSILGLIFSLLSSCTTIDEKEESTALRSIEEDSLSIVNHYSLALRQSDLADSLLQLAVELSKRDERLKIVYQINHGRYLMLGGKLDDASIFVQSTIDDYQKDTLNINLAQLHNLMAAVHAYLRNQEPSVFHFKEAIKVYEHHGDERNAAVVRLNLANIFFGRLGYESAYKYSSRAYEILSVAEDSAMLTLCLAVLSAAENKIGKEEEALGHAKEALRLSKGVKDLQAKVFANYAMGEALLRSKETSEAIEYFNIAIELGEAQEMNQWLLPVHAALIKAHIEKEDYTKALAIGKKLLQQARLFNNKDILYNVNKNISTAYANLNNSDSAYYYLHKAKQLFKEGVTESNERVIQEMIAKYETERKNNIILSQENKLMNHRTWLIGILILTIILCLGTIAS